VNPSEQSSDVKFEIGHVLFIDIVGYSKLLINEQSEQIQKLKEIVRGTEQVKKAEAEGKLLRLPTGDGGALVFRNSPEAPVLCAIEIAKALNAHPELKVRMGIHSGPVNEITDLNEQANIAGAGINFAQRVMDCGDAGHILLSKHVADDLEHYPHWQPHLHSLGECEVKHAIRIGVVNLHNSEVGNPKTPRKLQVVQQHRARTRWAAIVTALLLFSAIVAAFVIVSKKSTTPASAVPEKSIAVLPFENLSDDKSNAYFADGIQDEILTRLSKIADLKVISRTSTEHYKSAPENLPEIARQLGVAHIVEGSVQKSGDTVRVNVQLIKATSDSHLWADTFDRKLTDIFSVESEVAKAIADQLRAKLTGQEEQVITAKPTDNPEAYDAYLRGLAYTLKAEITPANALGAQKYLREAVRLDPKFAIAWAELASAESFGYYTLTLQPTAALRAEAADAANTAIALQPNLGEALLAKGRYYASILKDDDTAERYFERARQLLPNDSRVLEQLARVAWHRSQEDKSESYYDQAERLDPRNVALLLQRALGYIFHRRFPEAQGKLNQVLDVTPDDLYTPALEAGIAMMEGDLPRAAAFLVPLHPNADQTQVLEMQIYHAILERRPAPIIARLKEVLAKPDPALGYLNGELRFCLGWAQEVAGDHAAAQETWRQTRSELEGFFKDQPDNYSLMDDLALTDMGLGDKVAAFALAERAIAENPIEKDPNIGPRPIEILARVAAQAGEPDRAIAVLQKLLSIPYGARFRIPLPLTPALLRLDPMFDPLRNDPRFHKLCEEKQSENR
jgi:TolB-like protein/class 3 adenylate cyclase/Tfp pilus assembly protein PilF